MKHPSHVFTRPAWIFFDLDDTLWDFKGNSLKALRRAYASHPLLRQEFDSFVSFADVYHVHNSRLWEEYAQGKVSSELLKTERWRATLFPDYHSSETLDICRDINDFYLSTLASFPDCIDGAAGLLAMLSQSHMLGIISNGFAATQYLKLENSGLWRFITRVIVSDETTVQKPDPRLFRYAIEETGATGRPIMVGDNPSTDILGALRAGWQAIWFNPSSLPFPFSPDFFRSNGIDPNLFAGSCSSLKEVGELILSLGQSDTIHR